MTTGEQGNETRVAVLVDCDNTSPEVLEHALRVVAQFGRVVLRRGHGNHTTLANQCFEWMPPEPSQPIDSGASSKTASAGKLKQRPKSIVSAVKLLAADTSDGRVHVGALGSYLRRTDPAFSPQTHGHSGLLSTLKTYDLLSVRQEPGGHWTVTLSSRNEVPETATAQ